MRVIGLKILKNKLSEYVRLAASGEIVLVTDRDRVVAEIIPPHPSRARSKWGSKYIRYREQRPWSQFASPRGFIRRFRNTFISLAACTSPFCSATAMPVS